MVIIETRIKKNLFTFLQPINLRGEWIVYRLSVKLTSHLDFSTVVENTWSYVSTAPSFLSVHADSCIFIFIITEHYKYTNKQIRRKQQHPKQHNRLSRQRTICKPAAAQRMRWPSKRESEHPCLAELTMYPLNPYSHDMKALLAVKYWNRFLLAKSQLH